MRIWDIPVKLLCRQHLLSEHNECHAIFNIITKRLKGFAKHPEVMRWRGKLAALYHKHYDIAFEMYRRGYHHKSELDAMLVDIKQSNIQREQWQTTEKQIELLRMRCPECRANIDKMRLSFASVKQTPENYKGEQK